MMVMFAGRALKLCICICIYLFATRLRLKKDAKKQKCGKKWRGGLKETIELMLIRPPQLQFFADGIKNNGDGYKIISGGKLK